MKKSIVMILILATLFMMTGGFTAMAEDAPINVFINEQQISNSDVQPFMENDSVLVPLRAIFEALNANVEWDDATQTIFATGKTGFVILQIGNSKAFVNGNSVDLQVPAQIVNDKTFVPLRFVGEALGAEVDWDGTTNTVNIKYEQPSTQPSTESGAQTNTDTNTGTNTEAVPPAQTESGTWTPDETQSHPLVTMEMANGDKIKIELYPEIAPNTVNNFISLIQKKFYDGLTFHRVIPGFMIQGGDPEGTGAGGPGYTIKGEFEANQVHNPLKHTRGVLSMARTPDPNSAGSQFFIMVADTQSLDGQYAAFGKVTEGMEAVDKIVSAERDANDKPLEPQIIKTVTVELFDKTYAEPEKVNDSN